MTKLVSTIEHRKCARLRVTQHKQKAVELFLKNVKSLLDLNTYSQTAVHRAMKYVRNAK